MRFFERLKAAASAEWRVYTEHPFTNAMADGLSSTCRFRKSHPAEIRVMRQNHYIL